MDLRLSDEQRALCEEAAAFAAALRPQLEDDPEWRRQGMLSDGDSREVTRALGEAGWIGMTVAGSLLHLLTVLHRVRNLARAMPAATPGRDRALVGLAMAAF